MKQSIKLSIIVASFNTNKLLNTCLNSILKYTQKIKTEIIVIDNNSKDNSAKMVKQDFKYVKLYTNKKNLFLTKAINQGIYHAQGKYILVLNSDTQINTSSIENNLNIMDKDPAIGIVSCKHIDKNGDIDTVCSRFPTPIIDFFDSSIIGNLIRNQFKIKWIENLIKSYRYSSWHRDTIKAVDTVPGSYMLFRSDIVRNIGVFNEELLLFYQDLDFCNRAKNYGYKIIYNPRAQITHLRAKSVSLLPTPQRQSLARHDMLTYHKNHFGNFWWLFLFFATLPDAIFWKLKRSSNPQ